MSDALEDRIAELKAQLGKPGVNVAAIKAELSRLLVPGKETAASKRELETA